jgi:hypothetical protein
MSNRFFISLFILCVFSFNAIAENSDNPFAKNKSLTIGKDISWKVDKKAVRATKTARDSSGAYYHLIFDNKQLELLISSDANGEVPKKFSQLEIKNLKIDGKQSPLFSWCLKNQQGYNKFLQQGLSVKKNICEVDGSSGRFIMQLNRDALTAMQRGKNLSILLKPYRTPVELTVDISDFQEMYLSLNAGSKSSATPVATTDAPIDSVAPAITAVPEISKCWAKPPEKYKTVKSVEYTCADASAKIKAKATISTRVNQIKSNERKLAAQRTAEKEKQQKLVDEQRQKEQVAKLKQEELLAVEAAAVAASEVKQAELNSEISAKMISVCDKYWSKGEHRCYCQKYIEHAPSEIQQNSTCN